MNEIEIRWAVSDDADELGSIHACSFKEAYRDIIPEDMLACFTAEQRAQVFKEEIRKWSSDNAVLLLDGRRIGFITLGKSRDGDLDNKCGEVWGIYLLPSDWGNGYGRMLMIWGEDILKQRGYTHITLWVLEQNVRARRFYESLGYKPDGAVKALLTGKKLKEIRYDKKITNDR